MRVMVKLLHGNTVHIDVEEYTTVITVKEMLQRMVNVAVEQQRLLFMGYEMEDTLPMSDYLSGYDLTKNAIYVLSKRSTFQAQRSMRLVVQTLGRGSMLIELPLNAKCSDLQEHIENSQGVPCELQRLIFAGRELRPDELLCDRNITDNSLVHLLFDDKSSQSSDEEKNASDSESDDDDDDAADATSQHHHHHHHHQSQQTPQQQQQQQQQQPQHHHAGRSGASATDLLGHDTVSMMLNDPTRIMIRTLSGSAFPLGISTLLPTTSTITVGFVKQFVAEQQPDMLASIEVANKSRLYLAEKRLDDAQLLGPILQEARATALPLILIRPEDLDGVSGKRVGTPNARVRTRPPSAAVTASTPSSSTSPSPSTSPPEALAHSVGSESACASPPSSRPPIRKRGVAAPTGTGTPPRMTAGGRGRSPALAAVATGNRPSSNTTPPRFGGGAGSSSSSNSGNGSGSPSPNDALEDRELVLRQRIKTLVMQSGAQFLNSIALTRPPTTRYSSRPSLLLSSSTTLARCVDDARRSTFNLTSMQIEAMSPPPSPPRDLASVPQAAPAALALELLSAALSPSPPPSGSKLSPKPVFTTSPALPAYWIPDKNVRYCCGQECMARVYKSERVRNQQLECLSHSLSLSHDTAILTLHSLGSITVACAGCYFVHAAATAESMYRPTTKPHVSATPAVRRE